ncbi:MAG: hypothetical protein C4K48_03940 [Candidatus Thorarchaeota archaeon]|nr:MAG: hypothetical protein C4K48_03940 [Candidatus Thorarchaeota archaeon]
MLKILEKEQDSSDMFMVDGGHSLAHLSLLQDDAFQYRTVSVEHLQDMQDYMDALRRKGLFSTNSVFRSYVDNKSFKVPQDFPDAKSIIVVAVYVPLASVNVHYQNQIHKILIPPNYRVQDFTTEQLRTTIAKKVVTQNGYRIEGSRNRLFLKHLAVRSGLAEYGRNNICYVKGMGSMLSLYAFFTDYAFKEDHWREVCMMEFCRSCRICINECLTHAISDGRFVIDVERCVSLYNEIVGEIPGWIPVRAHNALIGCLRCQLRCPANKEVVSRAVELGNLTESETSSILECAGNDDVVIALCEKLKVSTPEAARNDLPVFSRNLKMLLEAIQGHAYDKVRNSPAASQSGH